MPEVSVIIPTLKRPALLKRAIDSVLGQSFQDFELIIISDGKDIDTDKIVSAYIDVRIKYLKSIKSRGASAARNIGIKASKGRYIAFLDDDDEWLPNKLEKQFLLIKNSPDDVGLIYCWLEYFLAEKSIKVLKPKLKGNILPFMLDKQGIGNSSTLLIKKEIIEKVGYFDENLLRGNDGDFIRRISKYYKVDFFPEILVKIYIEHGYKRISESKDVKIIINVKLDRIEKFKPEYLKYPKQYSNILSDLAYYYFLDDQFIKALNYFFRAFKTNPISLRILKNIAKIIIYFFRNLRGLRIEN